MLMSPRRKVAYKLYRSFLRSVSSGITSHGSINTMKVVVNDDLEDQHFNRHTQQITGDVQTPRYLEINLHMLDRAHIFR